MLFCNIETSGELRCRLCPRSCLIPGGKFGACGVRGSKNGVGLLPFYGHITAMASDPIEKKPLYHFRPGSAILSIGFAGCNLRCPFCQNWHISQSTDVPGRHMKPNDIISAALREESMSIAYTYSEPLVHAEFLLDCMSLAHEHGIANVLVSNGCVNREAARKILSLTDAANIDLKCFSRENYAQLLGGDLDTVLEFIRLGVDMGVHTEITTLVVPGLNDSEEELDACTAFVASLGAISTAYVPWHLSAYHPEYRWNAKATDPALLLHTAERARKKIPFVYTGNIAAGEYNDTICPGCASVLVRRRGYTSDISGLALPVHNGRFYTCKKCNAQLIRY